MTGELCRYVQCQGEPERHYRMRAGIQSEVVGYLRLTVDHPDSPAAGHPREVGAHFARGCSAVLGCARACSLLTWSYG